MADVIAHFLKPLPLRVQLKGEWWRIEVCPQNKSGKRVAIMAWTEATAAHRSHRLWGSHHGMLYRALVDGIRIKGGTPVRGLVTELRRAGFVHLQPATIAAPTSYLEEPPDFSRP